MLVASTDDETNIVTFGTAKTLAASFIITRVKNSRFLDTWRHAKGEALGGDFVFGSNLLTATTIVRLIGLPAARDVDTFAGGVVQMAEFEIPEGSPLDGQTVQEADRFDSLACAAIIREDDVVVPHGETRLAAGDGVIVIGSGRASGNSRRRSSRTSATAPGTSCSSAAATSAPGHVETPDGPPAVDRPPRDHPRDGAVHGGVLAERAVPTDRYQATGIRGPARSLRYDHWGRAAQLR